jgi:DNA-binding response OmpR family regulator
MRALVIEDNECLRELFQIFLEKLGFQADKASDGSVAFRMIKEVDYDVIISDMNMPVVNGMEFYKMIATHLPHLTSRIVFATRGSFNKEHNKFFRAVSCPVLFKPVSLTALKDTIQSLSGRCYEGKSEVM